MKAITMYELLGLVKEGKAPKKIKFKNEIYEYENNIKDSFIDYVRIEKETDERFYLSSYIGNNYINDIFTDKVEIIEEEKEIEEIPIPDIDSMENKRILRAEFKINELVREIRKLKEK